MFVFFLVLIAVQAYRAEQDDLKKQFQRALQALNKRDLMGDDHDFGASAEHRALFGGQSDAAALMQSSNDLILQATRDTLEMEDVASRVMQDLVEQRSALERFKVSRWVL